MSHFVPDPAGTQRELERIINPFMRAFADDVARRAKARLAAAQITGKMPGTIKPDPVRVGPSDISIAVGASSRRGKQMNEWDIGKMIHEGHGVILPVNKSVLKFKPRGSGRTVYAKRVRSVGGVPFMTDALRAANSALPSDRRFTLVIPISPSRGYLPHTGRH